MARRWNQDRVTSVISPLQAAQRNKIWETLSEARAHYCWPPSAIDDALNRGLGEMDIGCLCKIAARVGTRAGISADRLLTAAREGATYYVAQFLRGEVSRMLVRMQIATPGASFIEEVMCALRAEYLRLAPAFRPSRYESPSTWKTQGYEAFLRNRLRAVWSEVAQALRYYTADTIDPDREDSSLPDALRSEPEIGPGEIAETVASVLRSELVDAVRWEFFHATVYGGLSLRDVARNLRCAPSTLSEGMARPILLALRTAFQEGDRPRSGRASLDAIARCLPEVLNEERFVALVPRPAR